MDPRLDALRSQALTCNACSLRATCKQVVFDNVSKTGPFKLAIVGEAPGYHEDQTGVPFVGRSGDHLQYLLSTVGLSLPESYVTNAVKCLPPGNTKPEQIHLDTCRPWLTWEIDIVAPRLILALGNYALQTLTGLTRISNHRGQPLHNEMFKAPIIATYHPAAALRNTAKYQSDCLEDIALVAAILRTER